MTGITLFEDPAHPESWLRDAKVEYWDTKQQQWVLIMNILSDAAVHTHKCPQPVEASRFRVNLPNNWPGNIRLAEIVLHGETLGSSNSDIAATRPLAVLFDEGEDFKIAFPSFGGPWEFRLEGSLAGGRCLFLGKDTNIIPNYLPPMVHTIPN